MAASSAARLDGLFKLRKAYGWLLVKIMCSQAPMLHVTALSCFLLFVNLKQMHPYLTSCLVTPHLAE